MEHTFPRLRGVTLESLRLHRLAGPKSNHLVSFCAIFVPILAILAILCGEW